MRNLLIVSPHFPPVNAPDMHRVVAALEHLPSLGWSPRVLCVRPEEVAAPRDDALTAMLPEALEVERCGAFPLALTKLIGMRTLGWRALGSMDAAGSRMIAALRPDLVLFSTTQNPVTLLGPRWRRRFGIPYVVDIQDPWLTEYYSRPGAPRPPGGWKYRIARSAAARMEPRVLGQSSGVVAVSSRYLSDIGARHSWFAGTPQATIPFGIDPHRASLAASTARPAFERRGGFVHLASVGVIGPIMERSVRVLLGEVARFRRADPARAQRLRLHFIGTSYAPRGRAQASVLPIAGEFGVSDLIEESASRVPWGEAQATLRAADGILILASEDPAYTPSKMAGVFAAERPTLVVAPGGSRAWQISRELGLGVEMDPNTPADSFGNFIRDTEDPAASWRNRRRNEAFEATYTAQARTRQLCELLARAAGIAGTQP